MRFALVNPPWTFEGSIYFGCREPHLPLEFGYAKALLERAGHQASLIDGQMEDLSLETIRARVADFQPDFTVITTSPSYLFWRCAPPELRVPRETVDAVRDVAGTIVAVGPHASTTPATTLRKLQADIAIQGECEEALPRIARGTESVEAIAIRSGNEIRMQPGPLHAVDMELLPALRWPAEFVNRHRHHHHRFDSEPASPGAEVEFSRGCPYHCTFCAKDNFRDKYRRRPLEVVLREIDSLIDQGVGYVYFIDEIFLPHRELLEALAPRPLAFGIQTRIDLWQPPLLELLGKAGCVSIEAGVESISQEGRNLLDKGCRMSTADLAARLILAKQHVPFVQANLIEMKADSPDQIEEFRRELNRHGVWANQPVPLFPYPGSPEYSRRWGRPDDNAWERAQETYLASFSRFSDVQDDRPLDLTQLERSDSVRQ